MDGNDTSSQRQPSCELWGSYITAGPSDPHCTRAREAWALAGAGLAGGLPWPLLVQTRKPGTRAGWGEPPRLAFPASRSLPHLPHRCGRNSEAKLDSTLFLTPYIQSISNIPIDSALKWFWISSTFLRLMVVTILIPATTFLSCCVFPLLVRCHSPPSPPQRWP